MKSFFQLAEHASRHARKKLLEADAAIAPTNAAPAAGVAQQQQQNTQQAQATAPKATNAPEMNDADLIQGLMTNWDAFVKQNAAAMTKMKELQPAQRLAQTLNNLPGEMKKVVAALQAQKNAAGGQTPQPQQQQAGSNTAGAAAGGASTPKPMAPQA